MKIRNHYLPVLSCLLIAGCASSGGIYGHLFGYKYPLPLQTLKGRQICGAKVCDPGNNGHPFHYTEKVYVPDVEADSSPKDIAMQLVGHTVDSDDWSGRTPFVCAPDGVSPFSEEEVTTKGSNDGIATDYVREEKLRLDVNAKVEADLEAMKSLGLPTTKLSLQSARAKLTEAYSRLSHSVVEFKGRYYVFGLSHSAYLGVFQNGAKPACERILRATVGEDGKPLSRELITDVGIVMFTRELKENGVSEMVARLESEFKTSGVPFSLSASVDRSVDEHLRAVLGTSFAVISERRSGQSAFYRK